MRLFEWHTQSFAEHFNQLPEFVNYLSGVWQSRIRYAELPEDTSEEEQHEEIIQKQRFFDFTADGKVSARNYVGVVQYEGIRIEVFPKIFADDTRMTAKLCQLNLLYWLSYCRKIRFPFSFAAVSRMDFDSYLELLIYVFANYTEDVLSKQPYQAYQKVDEETTFLKGRLSFENYTKHNLSTGRWQNFYCIHEPFVYDNLFNRIIKYVTRRLSAISENFLNKEKLNEILFLLHDVSDLGCTAADCDKVVLNPLYEDHKHILDLCRLYLSNQVIDMESDESKNFCFLVPMEYIFEDFFYGFTTEKWPWLNIKSQSTDFLALNQGFPVFQIRNDIYVNNELIIDTKYKVRRAGDGLKAGVSQTDLYQMVSYAIRRNCEDVLLLYPETATSINDPELFQVPSDMLPCHLNIHVRNIDITFDDIHKAEELIRERIERLHPIFHTPVLHNNT
jgi:5-methylcytosine-specific restriction enzyme subunit McrC